jgi:hypothetical protein
MAYLDYHRTVIGYHGTSAKVADALVGGEPFTESTSIDYLSFSDVFVIE